MVVILLILVVLLFSAFTWFMIMIASKMNRKLAFIIVMFLLFVFGSAISWVTEKVNEPNQQEISSHYNCK